MPIYPTKRRKDGKTQYRVRINYTDTTGAHHQKEASCFGYQEAIDLERELLIRYSGKAPDNDLTLAEFFEIYKKIKATEVRETTFSKIVSNVNLHILPMLGNIRLNELDERDISDWKISMTEKKCSVAYCQKIWRELNGILNKAKKLNFIPENPTKNIENFRDVLFTDPMEKIQFYTPEQFIHFSSTANSMIENYFQRSVFMFFMVAYYTGMRKGEIHALRWTDIKGDIIQVRRSISQKIKGKEIVETPPKNKSSMRDIQIPKPLSQLLAQYKYVQQEHFGKKWKKNFRVILGDRCIGDTSLSNYNKKWASIAELPIIRIHDYRHSHASLLANEGINIQEIARRLGHSNVQVTWQRYAHLYPREEERALVILNKVEIPELSPNLSGKCKT